MSINKNKSEIAESFKNLLKKADEAKGLVKNKDLLIKSMHKDVNLNQSSFKVDSEALIGSERLGIKDIKRVPSNPFERNNKEKNNEKYEKFEYELTNKITNILNRHLYHWLNRELPKYSKHKLRKYIYEVIRQLAK